MGEIHHQVLVLIEGPGGGVREVGEKAEVEIGILVGKIARLKLFEEVTDLKLVEQERRNDDQGLRVVGDGLGEVDLFE